MPQKKYRVTLREDEENVLHESINKGKQGAQKRKRAQALRYTHEGYTDEMTADRAGMHRRGSRNCGNGLWRRDLRPPLKGSRGNTGPGPSPGKRRRGLSPWYAGRCRRAVPGGPSK